ncbi:MAG: RHS repeat-associated core domain-containing protein, partial [Bacteroidota bacterium]
LRPYRTYHYVQSTGYRFRTESNSHSFLVRPNKSYWMRLNSKTDYLYMEGRTNYHNFTYDSYGNVTTESLNLGGVSTQTTRASYARFGTIIPSQPTSITVTKSRTGQSSHSTTTAFSYNSLGQVTSKREFSGLPQQVTTSIAYNSYGVPTSRTVSTSGSSSRTTTMAYDSKYRFVTRVTNPLGQTSSSVYDEKWGEPLSKTGEDGLTTSYTYDGYGRRKRTTMPEGYSITDTYGWSINSSSRTVSYYNVAHPGRADVRIDFDKLGREKKRRTRSFRTYVYEERTYDSRGRKKTVRAPYKFGESTFTTTYYYDTYDRPIRESNPFGTTNYAYSYSSGILQVSKTEPDGKVMTMRMDASGKRVSSTDNGGTVNYTYNSQDLPTQVRLGSTVISTNAYDVYGRQTSIFDKNGGTTSYTYTGFGELKTQTNGNGHTFSMTYDKLGRMTRRSGPGESRSFSYLPSGRAINKLYYVSNSYSSNNEYYTYDAYGRLSQKRDRVDGQNYYTTFVNDIYGRVTQKTFPSGFRLEYEYDGNGFVNRIKNTQSGIHKVLFTTQSVNGRGQYTSYTLGNNKTSNISYLHGRPIHYSTSGIQDLRMVWDLASGNLTARQDNTKGRYESFTYDSMNRLASSRVSGQPTKSTFYHANGNISLKSDVGTYSYSSARNNAVTKVSNGSGTIPTITQDIRYTPFDQPERIVEGSHEMSFTYGADRQRLKSVHKINGAVRTTRYYFGDYEKQVKGSVTQHLHYVDAGQGVVAIVERKNGVDNYYFTYTDHLGSITKVTNAAGTMVAEQNFDAWGRRRNAHNWNYSLIGSVPDWLYRGYTFHEDLPLFGLINMNGRLYDPVLGRMLSPDNYVQPPYSSQNYNRYSYVLNNPLKFVDPSGEIIWGIVIIAAAVLGTANLAIQAINGEINSLGDGLRAFGAGALAGAALGLAVPALLSVPILGTALKVAAWIHVGTTALSVAAGIGRGIVTGDWTSLGNAFELALGNFYLDGNRNLLGQAWQGISRFTWEFLQTTIGHGFSQISNTIGQIDRVDYFGGATWAFRTNTENRWGVSIGNHINISLRDNIVDFTGDPLLMHEYGHTFDSQIFGIGYLFIVGIPSLISAANATQVPGEPRGVTTHDFRWYEMRANRHAARYFGDKFGVDWGTNFEVFYPRSRR